MSSIAQQHKHVQSAVSGLTEPEGRKDLGDTARIELEHAATGGETLHTGDPMIEAFEDAEFALYTDFDFSVESFNLAASNDPLWPSEDEEDLEEPRLEE